MLSLENSGRVLRMGKTVSRSGGVFRKWLASAFSIWLCVELLGVDLKLASAQESRSVEAYGLNSGALASQRIDLDNDGRLEIVTLDGFGKLAIKTDGGQTAQLSLPLGERDPQLVDAVLSVRKLANGEHVVAASGVRKKKQRVAAWVRWQKGTLSPMYVGPIGPVGADAEYSVEVEWHAGEVFRYQTSPSVIRCDSERRLFLERFVPDGLGRWVASQERLLPSLEGLSKLDTSSVTPVDLASTRPSIFRVVASNRQTGIERADGLSAPRELDDGAEQTVWRLPHDATGTFFTWRAESKGRTLRAMRVVPAPRSLGVLPTQFVVTLSASQHFVVSPGSPKATAEPFWVLFPQSLHADCVSLTIAQPATKPGETSAIAEVNFYSDLDGEGALGQLVEQLSATDTRVAEAAERTLALQAENVVSARAQAQIEALSKALSAARGASQRRIHGLLAKWSARAALCPENAQKRLVQTLSSSLAEAEMEDRPALFAALGHATKTESSRNVAVDALMEISTDEKRSSLLRAEATTWLVEHATVSQVLLLTKKLATDPRLRKSFVKGVGSRWRCEAWEAGKTPNVVAEMTGRDTETHARLLWFEGLSEGVAGCASVPAQSALSEHLEPLWMRIGETTSGEERFALRFRLLRAFAKVRPPTLPPFVKTILLSEPDAALRQFAAYMIARTIPLDRPQLQQALRDADPMVRATVLTSLVDSREPDLARLASHSLFQDKWPMVRRAAAEVVAAQCKNQSENIPWLEKALDDRDEAVATRALEGLSRCAGAAGFSRYKAALLDEKMPATVRGQACILVVRHGLTSVQEAATAHQAIDDGLGDLLDSPTASDRSLVSAIHCLRAVGEYGGENEIPLLVFRMDREAPIALRRSALESLVKICARQKQRFDKPARRAIEELFRDSKDGSDPVLRGFLPKLKPQCGAWLSAP